MHRKWTKWQTKSAARLFACCSTSAGLSSVGSIWATRKETDIEPMFDIILAHDSLRIEETTEFVAENYLRLSAVCSGTRQLGTQQSTSHRGLC